MATAGVGHKLGNGHSALELSNDGMTVYMSWMPRGKLKLINEASQGVGFYKIRDKSGKVVPNQYAIGTKNARSLKREIEIYKCPPHYSLDVPVCTIPASRDHDNLFGVLPGRMARFWDTLLRTKPGHSARRHYPISTTKNCHGTVVELLREGGLEFYVVAPGNLIYQDARSLVQWVEKASKLINDMNAQHKSVINEMTANQYFQRVPQFDFCPF
jgi:hypothetical protein